MARGGSAYDMLVVHCAASVPTGLSSMRTKHDSLPIGSIQIPDS